MNLGFPEVVIIISFLALVIFEITMFISMLRNKAISRKAKILWTVGFVISQTLAALYYYGTKYSGKFGLKSTRSAV
jgi:hypothetical protein